MHIPIAETGKTGTWLVTAFNSQLSAFSLRVLVGLQMAGDSGFEGKVLCEFHFGSVEPLGALQTRLYRFNIRLWPFTLFRGK